MKSTLPEIFKHLFRHRAKVALFLCFAVLGCGLSAVFFNIVDGVYKGVPPLQAALSFRIWSFQTLGAILIVAGCLLLEAAALGWDACSLRRLLESDHPSVKSDLFYTALFCSNLAGIYGFLMTLGFAYYLNHLLVEASLNPIFRHEGFFSSLLILLLLQPLLFYINHRLYHTRFMWEFHKIHHSATHMNMITAFRNHPIDTALRGVLYATPAVLFGVNPYALALYTALNGIIQILVHSEMDWGHGWLEKYVLIGPRAHRLHHSTDPSHAGRNFGLLVFWDRLFGTYHPGTTAKMSYGIDECRLNTKEGGHREVVTFYWSGLHAAAKEFFKLFHVERKRSTE